MSVHVCRFTSLDDVPKKNRRDIAIVLAAIHAAGRFSTFDVDSMAMARTVDRLFAEGYMLNVGGSYPWTDVRLTRKGRALIGLAIEPLPQPPAAAPGEGERT